MALSKTKKYYERNAGKWSKFKTDSFYQEEPFRIFEKLLKEGDNIIDIGCAYGIHVPLFLGIGRKLNYEGIDFSKNMVKLAKSRYPQIQFKVSDAIDFKNSKKFDGFWSAATLMHIPLKKWSKLLTNIESNVKKGAIGYISLPLDRPSPLSNEDQRHFEILDKNSFREIVKSRNWKILKTGTLPSSRGTTIWCWFIVRLP